MNPMINTDITSLGFIITNSGTANYANLCSPYYLMGGPNTFGSSSSIQKSYTGIPAHFRARITFFFLKIDDWKDNQLIVMADGISIPTNLSFNATVDSTIMKLCGDANIPEALRSVDLIFPHSSSTLDITITTDLVDPANIASWGIYDLTITYDICNLLYCKTCDGPSISNCLSCIPSLFLQYSPGSSTCESRCPDGNYSDYLLNTCPPCNSSCVKCSGPTSNDCLSCEVDKFLLVWNGSSTCVSECPSTHYTDLDRMCQTCDSSCLTCNGSTTKNCLSCTYPRYFVDNQCVTKCPGLFYGENSTATCMIDCPELTFPYSVSKICCPCNNCKSCVGFGYNQCITCIENEYLEEGSCVSFCSDDRYVNLNNASCDSIFFCFFLFLNINQLK